MLVSEFEMKNTISVTDSRILLATENDKVTVSRFLLKFLPSTVYVVNCPSPNTKQTKNNKTTNKEREGKKRKPKKAKKQKQERKQHLTKK